MTEPLTTPLPPSLSRNDVVLASERLRDLVRRTPVLRPTILEEECGASLWLKAENLQHIGAFKARGAANNVAQLGPVELAAGLVTYSSGNHAQAVAWAARHYGVEATIFMPTDAPAVKVAEVERLGASIQRVGTTSLERRDAALAFARERAATVIEPFDHPRTIAGQGTATLELREEVVAKTRGAELDALFVPVGGGGLIAGACLALEGTPTRIHAVEPEGCDSMRQSLLAGHIVSVEPGPTLADGLKPTRIGELNFAICRQRVSECHTVNDAELRATLRTLLLTQKVLVEPSGVAALAAATREAQHGQRVGVILSGGNVDPQLVADILTAR